MRDVLLPLISINEYHKIRIAVSYVKYSGVISVYPELRKFVKGGGKVQLLFGDDFGISQSKALRLLLRVGADLRLFVAENGENYHPKMWIFQGKNGSTSLTGSSNLSRGALTTNVEANILIERSRNVVKQQVAFFNSLWDDRSYYPIDEEWIDHYSDIERSLAAEIRYKKNGAVDHRDAFQQISKFIEGWMRHVSAGGKLGRYERWRGWYIIPEPASMDDSRLVEFKKILLAIISSKEYQTSHAVTLSVKRTNVLLNKAGIQYKGHGKMTQSAIGRRDLFIRQHKDYLGILGFITTVENKGPRISITPLGLSLARSRTPLERKKLFTKALYSVRWRWAPKLKLFDFLVRLMERVPKNRLYYHELSSLVIHAEHNLMFRPVLNLVLMFKSLPKSDRLKLVLKYDLKLEAELARKNTWAYYRYQRKIRELMALLGYAEGLSYHDDPDDCAKYIELVQRHSTQGAKS